MRKQEKITLDEISNSFISELGKANVCKLSYSRNDFNMKFRVKYKNVSRTALVDDESEVKLSRLHEVVSLTFSDLLHG